jgi:hypothetical protein
VSKAGESTIRRRLGILSGATALILVAVAQRNPASADAQIKDPKKWCTELMSVVATGDIDEMAAAMANGSGGRSKIDVLTQVFSPIANSIRQSGGLLSSDLIGEKKYGQSVVEFWYMLTFQTVHAFTRCRMVRDAGTWHFNGLDVSDDFVKIGAP